MRKKNIKTSDKNLGTEQQTKRKLKGQGTGKETRIVGNPGGVQADDSKKFGESRREDVGEGFGGSK